MSNKVKKARLKCVSKITKGLDALEIHNAQNYLEDYEVINKLSKVPPFKKEWIEVSRYELMSRPTQCERIMGKVLLDNNVKFIHQHPFYITGKIYFADFYIPSKHCLIEVDGNSHKAMTKKDSDADRDRAFHCIGIPTIRITDATCKNAKLLKAILQQKGIIPTNKK